MPLSPAKGVGSPPPSQVAAGAKVALRTNLNTTFYNGGDQVPKEGEWKPRRRKVRTAFQVPSEFNPDLDTEFFAPRDPTTGNFIHPDEAWDPELDIFQNTGRLRQRKGKFDLSDDRIGDLLKAAMECDGKGLKQSMPDMDMSDLELKDFKSKHNKLLDNRKVKKDTAGLFQWIQKEGPEADETALAEQLAFFVDSLSKEAYITWDSYQGTLAQARIDELRRQTVEANIGYLKEIQHYRGFEPPPEEPKVEGGDPDEEGNGVMFYDALALFTEEEQTLIRMLINERAVMLKDKVDAPVDPKTQELLDKYEVEVAAMREELAALQFRMRQERQINEDEKMALERVLGEVREELERKEEELGEKSEEVVARKEQIEKEREENATVQDEFRQQIDALQAEIEQLKASLQGALTAGSVDEIEKSEKLGKRKKTPGASLLVKFPPEELESKERRRPLSGGLKKTAQKKDIVATAAAASQNENTPPEAQDIVADPDVRSENGAKSERSAGFSEYPSEGPGSILPDGSIHPVELDLEGLDDEEAEQRQQEVALLIEHSDLVYELRAELAKATSENEGFLFQIAAMQEQIENMDKEINGFGEELEQGEEWVEEDVVSEGGTVTSVRRRSTVRSGRASVKSYEDLRGEVERLNENLSRTKDDLAKMEAMCRQLTEEKDELEDLMRKRQEEIDKLKERVQQLEMVEQELLTQLAEIANDPDAKKAGTAFKGFMKKIGENKGPRLQRKVFERLYHDAVERLKR